MRFRLVPVDDTFFQLFSDSAENAAEAARRLQSLVNDIDRVDELYGSVVECERKGDDVAGAILRRLDTSFVTPFDREDIHALAEELDDVVDDILAVANLLRLVGVKEILPEMREQADLLVQMAEQTVELMARLERMKEVRPYLDAIDRLESEGDAVHQRTIARLFGGEFEALDVLRWKDIVQAMESTLNAIEDVSDIVESIVLKHA
jgi:predicted phosphate transport protein (TIGR00153 family)